MSLFDWGAEERIEVKVDALFRGLSVAEAMLQSMQRILISLKKGQERIMALSQEQLDAMRALDAATTAVGTKIDALLARLEAGGLSAGEEASVFAEIKAQTARLTGFAADPENPVPPTE